MSSVPLIPPTAPSTTGKTLPVHSPDDHRVRLALRHSAPVGDGHAGGVFSFRLDLHVDVATVKEGGLEEGGDHAG